MNRRIDFAGPGAYDAMDVLDRYIAASGLERKLVLLVQLRASQINRCADCMEKHWRELRAEGETEQRLGALDAWRQVSCYSDRERAALAWTEAVTLVAEEPVPTTLNAEMTRHFSEQETADLTLVVAAMTSLEPPVHRTAAAPERSASRGTDR